MHVAGGVCLLSLNTSTVLDAQWGFEETFLSKEGALVERAVYAACLLDCIPKGHAGVLTQTSRST